MNWMFEAEVTVEAIAKNARHVLVILAGEMPLDCVYMQQISAKLQRTRQSWADLQKTPMQLETSDGCMVAVLSLDAVHTTFERHTLLRKALQPLLLEQPESLAICVYGSPAQRMLSASLASYVALLNAQPLPKYKQHKTFFGLQQLVLLGVESLADMPSILARVQANTLCRNLTMQPSNALTPALYQAQMMQLAASHGWQTQVFTLDTLKAMGAGAFVAVAQGSAHADAVMLKLSWRHAQAKHTIALVGKGICFDTGGHNLKSSKYMLGMHQDMNGSAVAVGVLQAVSQLQLPVNVDCWLALAENHIGPNAYKQNDVVTALNGLRIEVIHTDAEGRMVLADTLTMASRERPQVMLDFATLTGSMQTALGTRMSGIVSNLPALAAALQAAGDACGERVVVFPYAEDYDAELQSEMADIKQCTLDSDADHILAARFLGKFIEGEVDWCHVDLSAYAHKDGLGAVASEVNGFGVALTLQWLENWLAGQG